MPFSQLDHTCGGGSLSATSITGTFFDVRPWCAHVTAGESLSFSMTLENVAPATCSQTTRRCSGTSNFCFYDLEDCEPRLNASMGPDQYASGETTVRGMPAGDDLAFKTFVF